MRSRRPRTAITFVLMGVVLLVAIFIGQQAGDKMLFLATQKADQVPELQITPAPDPSDDAYRPRNWRRLEVVSVATDPAFPDPRVTPPPTPTPRPPPPTAPPTLRPLPTMPSDTYTPPPLPLPLVSHDPGEEPTPYPAPT
jgi:hypothetical protein